MFRQLPASLIVQTSDLMQLFSERNIGVQLIRDDVRDIIADIIITFLNEGEADCLQYVISLPEFNRMRDTSFLRDMERQQRLRDATLAFKNGLESRLRMLDCFEGGTFNYFFFAFVQDDLLLHRLPH